ncbi:MAG: TRAP transporter small permease [Rhodobacteraceae bacterium]|nr:TRAP transporter small permease [Paracoccaceae bacterium]
MSHDIDLETPDRPSDDRPRGLLGALAMAGLNVSAVLIMLTMLAISANAVLRYVFDLPLHLVIELSGFVFLFMIFLGAAGTYLRGGHIAVELVTANLPPLARLAIRDIAMGLVGAVYVGLLIWGGSVATWRLFDAGAKSVGTTPIPHWIVMAIVPLGSVLLMFAILSRLLARLRRTARLRGMRK